MRCTAKNYLVAVEVEVEVDVAVAVAVAVAVTLLSELLSAPSTPRTIRPVVTGLFSAAFFMLSTGVFAGGVEATGCVG